MPSIRWGKLALAMPVVLTVLMASGCGHEPSEVSGTVTFAGKPVPSGSVILYCSDGQIVRGVIEPDGRYAIPNVPRGPAVVTVQAHARVPTGLRYKQNLPPTINGPTLPVSADQPEKTVVIPSRYGLPEESRLSVVVDREQVTYNIDLKP